MIEGAEVEPQSLRDVVSEVVEAEEVKLPEEKPDRARDEAGRFTAAEKAAKEAREAKEAKPEAPKAEKAAEKVEKPAYTPPKPPSTWKKELETHWGTLPPEVHAEISRREADFAKGVSAYKAEYDRLRPLGDALKPYEQMMQQANITPDKFIHSLASTHQVLTSGDKESKLRAFAKFAQDYQIPLHEMLVQGEDGKVYFNQQYFNQPQPQPQGLTREEARKEAQQVWLAAERSRQLNEFMQAKDSSGNPRYPHFEALKQTMDGLLRAGLAKDLPTAYDAALRHPDHSTIYDAMQKQQREADEAEKKRIAEEAAKKARQNVVSARPRTPPNPANGASKGLRDILTEVVDERAS